MTKNEFGRTIVELIATLAIIGILSVTGLWGYQNAMQHKKIDEILRALQEQTILINAALQNHSYTDEERLDAFLKGFTTQAAGYTLSFHPSSEQGGFVSEITDTNGKPIHGKFCRELIKKMAEQEFVSDVAFSLKDEELDDGTIGDITVNLNGKYVDLNALCGM